MSDLETNVFPILNLTKLSSRYRLYRIRGLTSDQEEYEPNIQSLIRKLSYLLRSPVTVTEYKGELHLALKEGASEPPSPFNLVRATAYFEPTDQILTLDYEHPTPETEATCLRFLQFSVEGALFTNRQFWQPTSGNPFFERQPVADAGGVLIYRGYAVRVVAIEPGKFGLCVDVQHKYVSKAPLSAQLSREDFRRFKHSRCVYHFGRDWYEIRLHDHTGLTVSEQLIPDESKSIPLIQYIAKHAPKPLPPEVVNLDPKSAAVTYPTSRGEFYSAAASLCYPIFETSDPRVRRAHRDTILPPHIRRRLIRAFVQNHLTELHDKGMTLQVSRTPLTVPRQVFLVPDLAFGNDSVLSVRGTTGATYVSLNQLGQARLSALLDPKMGPYVRRPLDQQYVILPQSVADSFGSAFLDDLKAVVNEIYPQEIAYDPVPIIYDDLGPKTFAAQGRAILAAVDEYSREPGYGIAIIHEITDRKRRQHDALAAMVMRELRKRSLFVSVIHTTVPQEGYQLIANGTAYQRTQDRKRSGRLKGYLRNVAINKVLLTNERWPFVLATPLNADLTITIDVQLHTACFTYVGKQGPDIRTVQTTSNQKEQLSRAHVQQVITNTLREEGHLGRGDIKTIVVQRDGRLYTPEIRGIKEAIAILKKEGVLPDSVTVTFVEISKSSPAPLRLFEREIRSGGQEFIQNPQVGTYALLNSRDGYICSTGREFNHLGTANPLHVKYVEGSLPLAQILEDVYAQTCLAWTRPEDCSRYPITIKLSDIRLKEHAGGYDEDALEFGDEVDLEEAVYE